MSVAWSEVDVGRSRARREVAYRSLPMVDSSITSYLLERAGQFDRQQAELMKGISCEPGTDEQVMVEICDRLMENIPMAREQLARYQAAELVVIVGDCPDVRVDFPVSAEIQDVLSAQLGKRVAVLPLGAFGAGIEPKLLDKVINKVRADGKQPMIMLMPHTYNEDVAGCGAVKAYEADGPLPHGLKNAVSCCIKGIGTDKHAHELDQILNDHPDVPGVIVLYAHGLRRFLRVVKQTKHELADKAAAFFKTESIEKARFEAELGIPADIDVTHQDAPYAVVEIGADLLPMGGAPVLLSGDRHHWDDPFVFTTSRQKKLVRRAIAAMLYPRIAQAHGDFASTDTLTVIYPEGLLAVAEAAVKNAKKGLNRYVSQREREGVVFPTRPKFYDNVVYVQSGVVAGQVTDSAEFDAVV